MSKRIVTTRMSWQGREYRIRALFEGERPIEMEAEEPLSHSLLGEIYVGRVEKIVPGIQSAFVQITKDLTCFLPLDKLQGQQIVKKRRAAEDTFRRDTLAVGDELLVQISREAIRNKLPTVTAELSLSGTYLVVYYGSGKVTFSAKLDGESRQRLSAMAERFREEAPAEEKHTYGIIFRTLSANATEESLRSEYEQLQRELSAIVQHGIMRTVGSCLYRNDSRVPEMVKRFAPVLEEILTDEEEEFQVCASFLSRESLAGYTVTRYQDPLLSLDKRMGLERWVRMTLQERVDLPSGGFLVIQPTEAFVSIDVNSGRKLQGAKAERFFYEVNVEAAEEIARQLRLRGLSGLILIDFITMQDTAMEERLLSVFRSLVREDPVQTQVVDMTAMHITEVTRRKIRKPFREQIGGTHDAVK